MGDAASRPLVVLHEPGDGVADWLAAGLRGNGQAVRLVTSLDICTAARFELSIGRARPTLPDATIELADGTALRAASVRGVLNRLAGVPRALLDRVAPEDRTYVEGEWAAALVGALEAWAERGIRVLDPPHPYALGGRWRSGAEWSVLASRAGFRVAPWRWPLCDATDAELDAAGRGAAEIVLVVGKRALGSPAAVRAASGPCLALAGLAGAALLAVEARATPSGVWFAGASARPDLRFAGAPAIEALLEAFA